MKKIEKTWKSHDGITLQATGWEPDDGNLKGVVCLVHGIGEHILRYTHVAAALTGRGYVLLGADIRGHGRSGGPRGHFPSVDAVFKDIGLLLGNARSLYPGVPLFLYGHSLGGILVLYYSLTKKPDVMGVIVTSPGLKTVLHQQPVKVLAARVLGALFPRITISSNLDVSTISRDEEVKKAYQEDHLVHDRISLGLGRIMLDVCQQTLEHSGEFTHPLLLMHGKKDDLAFPSGSIDFAAPLAGKITFILWEEGFHELHNEPEKQEVLSTMIRWLDEHSNRSM